MPKILFATSEASPLIKTGGLADVSGSLPAALNKLRWSTRLLLPAYPQAMARASDVKTLSRLRIPGIAGVVTLHEGTIPDQNLTVWFVDYDAAFNREGNPYLHPDGHDWPDNAERFTLFAKAAVTIAQNRAGIDWVPDVIHCNDWQTGLIPALLHADNTPTPTVFTVHNLAYQGLFQASAFHSLGLPPSLWSPEALEFHGNLSFIKGGLVFANKITTVSPNYALEIQTPEYGCGLEGLLQHRKQDLLGILNGINDVEWDPANDPNITKAYDVKHISDKEANKLALLKSFSLPKKDGALLLGSVGRLADQKGIDVLLEILPELDKLPVQLVLLGSGDSQLEKSIKKMASQYPDTVSVHLGYDEALAHQIEAGADAFIMPSRFEPCGLNQLYSLRYGTLPIVHAVGGLKDTVVDASPANCRKGMATGFCFTPLTRQTLLDTILRAVELYAKPEQWQRLVTTAMQQCFTWEASANRYSALYRSLLTPAKQRVTPVAGTKDTP